MTTTVTLTLLGTCPSQGHARLRVDVTGVGQQSFDYGIDELREDLDWSDAKRVARDLLRLHFRGATLNQVRTQIQAGITLEI